MILLLVSPSWVAALFRRSDPVVCCRFLITFAPPSVSIFPIMGLESSWFGFWCCFNHHCLLCGGGGRRLYLCGFVVEQVPVLQRWLVQPSYTSSYASAQLL
ncbi:hypothetical protein P8452_42873 [Trifolium repens]|nr:hypothetical protein P8452_42873 [Trifolium repens]